MSQSSFYRWRTRMGDTGWRADHGADPMLTTSPGRTAFGHKLHRPGQPWSARAATAGNSLELRLDLGGGVVLQIVRR